MDTTVNATIENDSWQLAGTTSPWKLSKAKSSISSTRIPFDYLGSCSSPIG